MTDPLTTRLPPHDRDAERGVLGGILRDPETGCPWDKVQTHQSIRKNFLEETYEALEALDAELVEMKRCKSNGLCCGAGGAQMFKEEEKGTSRINIDRSSEALATGAGFIASACPFCNTMMTDGVKLAEKEESVQVLDIAEMVAASME